MATSNNFNAAVSEKRKEKDVVKLLMSDFKVTPSSNPGDFIVLFKGPKDSPYETGIWSVHVLLPDQYPYKSPSIGFENKIFHPNIDFLSGTVCLDVINQTWSPMFDLINIFEVFLPQLLLYPNPSSPLNPEAASLMMKDASKYNDKVVDHVRKYAQGTGNKGESKKFYEEIKKTEEISNKTEMEIESLDEEMSDMSGLSDVSELSMTSEIELLEN